MVNKKVCQPKRKSAEIVDKFWKAHKYWIFKNDVPKRSTHFFREFGCFLDGK